MTSVDTFKNNISQINLVYESSYQKKKKLVCESMDVPVLFVQGIQKVALRLWCLMYDLFKRVCARREF